MLYMPKEDLPLSRDSPAHSLLCVFSCVFLDVAGSEDEEHHNHGGQLHGAFHCIPIRLHFNKCIITSDDM